MPVHNLFHTKPHDASYIVTRLVTSDQERIYVTGIDTSQSRARPWRTTDPFVTEAILAFRCFLTLALSLSGRQPILEPLHPRFNIQVLVVGLFLSHCLRKAPSIPPTQAGRVRDPVSARIYFRFHPALRLRMVFVSR